MNKIITTAAIIVLFVLVAKNVFSLKEEETAHLKTKFELIALQAEIEAKKQFPEDKKNELRLIANSLDNDYHFVLDSLIEVWRK